MESINAKAIYLQRHAYSHKARSPLRPKPSRTNQPPTLIVPQKRRLSKQTPKDKPRIRLQLLPANLKQGWSCPSFSVGLKQQSILVKVAEGKARSGKGSKLLKETISHMRVTKYAQQEAERLELSLTKPTDQLFHQLANARLAERLLFAKPSSDISLSSLKHFYQAQQRYKSNISKMPSLASKRRTTKRANSKSWLD